MNRKSRTNTRRSSILKVEVNREDDTGIIVGRNRRSSRRVSFAEMCQIKEFPRDSPKVYKDVHTEDGYDGKEVDSSIGVPNSSGITGLDKLLTGAIQTPYQDVAECPIPEMSSESFNIFDFNKTVLETVDMETTQVGGNIDAFLPQMDFQNEPSMELKFDATSFLKSLNKPNDRLETTQIYSPNRNSGLFTPQFDVMEHDKENVVPMEASTTFGNEQPSGFDSKMFLQRLFGGTSGKVEEDQNELEEMEETACIGDTVKVLNANTSSVTCNDNVTKYYNPEDVTMGIEETKCIGGIVVERGGMNHLEMDKENSLLLANKTVNMEETKPVGGILKSGNTTLYLGLRMQQAYDSSSNAENNVTKCFNMYEDADNGIEETRCVGGILSKDDKIEQGSSVTLKSVPDSINSKGSAVLKERKVMPFEETTNLNVSESGLTVSNGGENYIRRDVTVNFNVTGIQDDMEETRTVGGVLDKTVSITRNKEQTGEINSAVKCRMDSVNQTMAMEETLPVGKILDILPRKLDSAHSSEQLVELTTMEETKPVGGILKSCSNKEFSFAGDQREDMDMVTKNLTVPMEMTRPVGGLLDKNSGKLISSSLAESCISVNTVNTSVMMEETRAVGGILDRSIAKITGKNTAETENDDHTVNYTVAMEETRPVGKILNKTNTAEDDFETKQNVPLNRTVTESVPVDETEAVGGVLNKTSDKTVYFEDVHTDWLSEDLKPHNTGKAADGTESGMRRNKSASLEETNCLGGILTDDMEMYKGKFENIYDHAQDDKNNKTVLEPVQMEETRCVTEKEIKDVSQISEDECLKRRNDVSDMKTEVESVTGTEKDMYVNKNEAEVNSDDVIVDDEITLKFSNKRNFEECTGETGFKEEKTREVTQTGLAKLKEMLKLSKRKTAVSLRQGDIRTPSKLSPFFPGSAPGSVSKASCSDRLRFEVTKSPVHKRQRLLEDVEGANEELDDLSVDEKTDATAALLGDDGFSTALLDSSKFTHTSDVQGIDDEEMPDTMHVDLCTSSSSGGTHSDKNSTVHSDSGSATMLESRETRSSSSDSRNMSSMNLSMLSNKSFAYSFVVPDGPLSLESFFRLTFTLMSKIQRTRSSTIFAQSIDMEDLAEVLNAELTLNPMVQAKKKMTELFTQQIQRSEDTMDELESSLEEMQPEIFQLCAKASSEELENITGQLRSLLSACHKEAEIAWKEGTKQMFTEALEDIQGEGVRRAEEMLQKVECDSQSVDDLLTSLDDELEFLDKKERRLEELQNKQDILNRELEKLSLSLQERSTEEKELESVFLKQSQHQQTRELITSLKQEMVAHLICCEWNLEVLEEDNILFTFLDDKLELRVDFSPGVEEKQISNIVWRSRSTSVCRYFEDRVAVQLALNGISTTNLRQKFTTISSLPKLLHEVSSSINEIKRFCKDLEDVNLHHVLKFHDNSICTELWDKDTMDFVTVTFIFDPSHPLTQQVKASVAVRIGDLKSCDIEEKLREVSHGAGYLPRLLTALNFKQLQ